MRIKKAGLLAADSPSLNLPLRVACLGSHPVPGAPHFGPRALPSLSCLPRLAAAATLRIRASREWSSDAYSRQCRAWRPAAWCTRCGARSCSSDQGRVPSQVGRRPPSPPSRSFPRDRAISVTDSSLPVDPFGSVLSARKNRGHAACQFACSLDDFVAITIVHLPVPFVWFGHDSPTDFHPALFRVDVYVRKQGLVFDMSGFDAHCDPTDNSVPTVHALLQSHL